MKKLFLILFVFIFTSLYGCDFIYGVLQKEGAQEKSLLGSAQPFEYNAKVEEIQRLLKIHGFSPGGADGKLGAKAREAIAAFQEAKGLKVSRFVDTATWEALNVFTKTGLVVNGEVNLEVVQGLLEKQGFNPGKIDGKMGAKTNKAIQDFQKAKGLKVDGKIGPNTLTELNAFLLTEMPSAQP